jgi:N-acyl-phosphatidylethanolamine-hydrolysing phospholipase D
MKNLKAFRSSRRTFTLGLLGLGAGATTFWGCSATPPPGQQPLQSSTLLPPKGGRRVPPFRNPYVVAEDTGHRVAPTYFLRRAWVQVTRDLARTHVPPTIPLDLSRMANNGFAVSWLGHSALLLHVAGLWILMDPVLSDTAGPVDRFGPARLTPLPIPPASLPHIDVVLISHDHYDHLDLFTMRLLARQSGGPPRFMAGLGLGDWFKSNVGQSAQEFDWWQSIDVGKRQITFVPAQHNSGRSLWNRNQTLWGGWVVQHAGRTFYYAGDTSYVADLFKSIRERIGRIDLSAIPIGAYLPREMMRFEHTSPDDAVQAHGILGSLQSFGVHWGTFQLGDEEPFQPAIDLSGAIRKHQVSNFGITEIGSICAIEPHQRSRPHTIRDPAIFQPAVAWRG